jgi:hypothetical protein
MSARKKPSAAAVRAAHAVCAHLYGEDDPLPETIKGYITRMATSIDAEFAPQMEALRALTKIRASCDIVEHKPLRHPRCPTCQLSARLEEARDAIKKSPQ